MAIRRRIKSYVFALVVLAVATAIRFLFDPWLSDYTPFPTYFAAVAVVGLYGGVGPAMLTLVLGGLIADALFMPPRGQVALTTPEHWISLCLFLASSLIIIGMAESLRRSRSKLRASNNRLKEASQRKDQFLSMLAHELRNPLAPIVSAVEAMRFSDAYSSNSVRPAIDIIDRQSKQLKYLVDELLDLARISTGRINLKREPLEVGHLIRQFADTATLKCDSAGIEFTVATGDKPMWVNADRARFQQILDNLVDNACKFTESGGTIELTVRREGNECVLTVKDSGIGIESSDLPHIFNVFERAKASDCGQDGGLGLGLHLVKRLVGKHDGTVVARSEGTGRGSEFIVRLPLGNEGPAETVKAEARTGASTLRRVLIIDDNVDAANSMQMSLKMDGHDVRMATEGAAGLAIAETFQPEIALVDIRMPEMDGYEVAEKLRARFGTHIRLVAVTGYSQELYRLRAQKAGFDAHLVKPASIEVLTAAMNNSAALSIHRAAPATG